LASCQTRTQPREVPAVIIQPTAQSRAELLRVVSDALHGAPVTLGDDALTRDSTLIVERAPHRDAEGRLLDGRAAGRPERFRLVQSGSLCVLVQESTGQRWTLASVTCAPR
jgi:hypothetical protein